MSGWEPRAEAWIARARWLSIPHPLHTAIGAYFDEHPHDERAGFAIEGLSGPPPVFLPLQAVKPR